MKNIAHTVGDDTPPESEQIGALSFASIYWEHRKTTIDTLQETFAYTGHTLWEGVDNNRRFRLQWEWMFEPYFQRPFTMDMNPRSNAIFKVGEDLEFSLPASPRIKILRATIDRIQWQPIVLEQLYEQDGALKARIEKLLSGISLDHSQDT